MTEQLSAAQILAQLPPEERDRQLAYLDTQTKAFLNYHWPFWARPNQLPPGHPKSDRPDHPGDWLTWLALAGRGFGKTRTASEWIRMKVCGSTPLSGGSASRIAVVAETAADARDVMVEGPSGILAVHPPDFRPTYEPSKRRLTWNNGAVATLYNGNEPDQLRGPQHDCAAIDELAKYSYARETWDMLQFGLRVGNPPQQIITTTPRPIPLLKEIIAAQSTVITHGSTIENRDNLAPSFMERITARYAGTRLGRQELEAEILEDLPGALWTREMLEKVRVQRVPQLRRIVVAVDPSGTRGKDSYEGAEEKLGDDVGIIVAGRGTDDRCYILADETCNLSPDGWGRRAVKAYYGEWSDYPDRFRAERLIAERNFGGAMVEHVIRSVDRSVSYKEVVASRGKFVRAEPVASLFEQGRCLLYGSFPELEDQLCLIAPEGYSGEGSPDRADAMVWAVTELMLSDSHYGLLDVL